MSGLLIFQTVCLAITLVNLFHVIVWARCTTWTTLGIPLIHEDFPAYLLRKAHPPWFVRYAAWLDRVVFRKRVER